MTSNVSVHNFGFKAVLFRMIFRIFLNNVFGETLPQCFSDPALLFLREESWLVRERETRRCSGTTFSSSPTVPDSILQLSE